MSVVNLLCVFPYFNLIFFLNIQCHSSTHTTFVIPNINCMPASKLWCCTGSQALTMFLQSSLWQYSHLKQGFSSLPSNSLHFWHLCRTTYIFGPVLVVSFFRALFQWNFIYRYCSYLLPFWMLLSSVRFCNTADFITSPLYTCWLFLNLQFKTSP